MQQQTHFPAQANWDPVRLRSFVPKDLRAMYALDQICFRNGIAYSLAEFKLLTRNSNSFTVIAEIPGDRLVGFAITERTRRSGMPIGHVITIDVDPQYRRRGVGRMLMQSLEQDLIAHQARRCILEVAIDDPGAQEFYAGIGYHTTARIEGYYMGHLDAMVMEKELAETVRGN